MLVNYFVNKLRTASTSPSIAIVVKVFAFWVLAGLVLFGLQSVRVSNLGGAAAPVAAGIAIVVLLILIMALLRVDKGSLHQVGLSFAVRKNLPEFALGVGLGVVVVAGMIFVILLLTPLEIEATADRNVLAVLGVSFIVFFALALMEELGFRSYSLFRLQQAWGIRPAIYVTSIAFAFYHGLAFENLLGPGVWGLFFGYMAVSTNNIALPTGFHLGLNWLQALMGMKPQYSPSIWELSIGTGSDQFDVQTIGFALQVLLLIVGIVIVEMLVRNQRQSA